MSAELQLLIGFLSLASALVGLYAGLRQVKASRAQVRPSYDHVVPRSDEAGSPTTAAVSLARWYDHPAVVLLLLLAFWPAGLFALARSRTIGPAWKKAVYIGLGLLMVLAMLGA